MNTEMELMKLKEQYKTFKNSVEAELLLLKKMIRDLETFKVGAHRDEPDMLEKRIVALEASVNNWNQVVKQLEASALGQWNRAELEKRIAALEPKFKVGDRVVSKGREMVVRELREESYLYECSPLSGDKNQYSWCIYQSRLSPAPQPKLTLAERLREYMNDPNSCLSVGAIHDLKMLLKEYE